MQAVVNLLIAAQRKRVRSRRTMAATPLQVRSLLRMVAKAAQHNVMQQSADDTTDLLKSRTRKILIPAISSIRSQDAL
jgi:hypothetical protein